jgi:hypothetical protein
MRICQRCSGSSDIFPQQRLTSPLLAQYLAIEDLLDAGHDLRLDQAYPDFYREQQAGNVALPTPLDTQTLFNQLARRLLQQQSNANAGAHDANSGPGVQELFNLVQGACTVIQPICAAASRQLLQGCAH